MHGLDECSALAHLPGSGCKPKSSLEVRCFVLVPLIQPLLLFQRKHKPAQDLPVAWEHTTSGSQLLDERSFDDDPWSDSIQREGACSLS
jgi:hypothetical protein